MNRERLTILRDHLASLPDERVDMRRYFTGAGGFWITSDAHKAAEFLGECGTAACIAGWTVALFGGSVFSTDVTLGLNPEQDDDLCCPEDFQDGRYTRADAIAAIQSMLDSPDDDALPVWPEARS